MNGGRGAGERGNVLLLVSIIIVVSMGLVSSIIEHSISVESKAVEQSLMKVRSYWAMMGHVNHFYSRTRRYAADCLDDASTNPTLSDFRAAFNSYAFADAEAAAGDEVCNGTSDAASVEDILRTFHQTILTSSGNRRLWDYADFDLRYPDGAVVLPVEVSSGGAGILKLAITSTGLGTAPSVESLDQRVVPLHVEAAFSGDEIEILSHARLDD